MAFAPAPEDSFSWWYRFRTTVVWNLLQVVGPAALDRPRDPRAHLEDDYLRRKALHESQRTGRTVTPETMPTSSSDGFDILTVAIVLGVLGVIGTALFLAVV